MNLKRFREEFAGAPFTVREFAEVIIQNLDATKPGAKYTADTVVVDNLRAAAAAFLHADDHLATTLQKYRIDIG